MARTAQVAVTAMQNIRTRMLLQPKNIFFASVLLSTPLVEDENCPTAYTDGRVIGYSAQFIESLPLDVAIFVLAHETAHIILLHPLRFAGKDHALANIAADYVVNLWLHDCGFHVWHNALLDRRFAGMSFEQVYDLLLQEGGGSPSKALQKFGTGDNGSRRLLQGGLGDDIHPPVAGSMSDAERAVLEQQIKQRVAQAASMARQAGVMHGALERMIGGLLDPQLPWTELLAAYMTRIVKDDESWNRRNRRFRAILPGRNSLAMGEIVNINDTSGSIGPEELDQIAAEINCVADTVRPERIRVVWADDCDCAREEVFERGEPIELHPLGGGGTDMRKPLAYVEQFDPIVCVLITDGYTPWPEIAPPYPLIVCCTTNQPVPDYADVVRLRPRGAE